MMSLLGAVGWGLLATAAVTHLWHHRRLRELLAMHLDHERIPAAALVAAELLLVIGLAATWLADHPARTPLGHTAVLVAAVFMAWILRLLTSGSELPCACSFSAAPTSWWSFARAACVALAGFIALAPASPEQDHATIIATLAVGWALAAALYVLPEALGWPGASQALLTRVDAHEPAVA